MPISCKCILDRLKYKGAITEKEYDKLLRNLKGTEWHPYPDEKPTANKEYNITIKNPKSTSTAYYFTEDDTWYGGDDLYVPNSCISAWAELPERYEENNNGEEDSDLVARRILADIAGMSVNDDINAISKRIIFGDKPAEKCCPLTGDYFENDVLAPETAHDNKNDVIIVQLDTVMPAQMAAALRKDLVEQKKEGVIIVPPWAHVVYVGDECEIEIKEMEDDAE